MKRLLAFLLALIVTALVCAQNSVEDEFQRAQHLHDRGDFDDAIASWSVWLKKHPKDWEAYFKRSSTKDYKGDFAGAIADINRAIEFSPKEPHPYVYWTLGRLKRETGDFNGAIYDYTRVIKRGYIPAAASYERGIIHYLKKNWLKASADFEVTGRQQKEAVWSEVVFHAMEHGSLMNYVVKSRLGRSEDAHKELRAWLEKRDEFGRSDWASQLASFLLGTLDEVALFKATKSDSYVDRGRPCQAWYYFGMKRLIAGQKAEATDCFRKSIATGHKEFNEYTLATAELKWLGEK